MGAQEVALAPGACINQCSVDCCEPGIRVQVRVQVQPDRGAAGWTEWGAPIELLPPEETSDPHTTIATGGGGGASVGERTSGSKAPSTFAEAEQGGTAARRLSEG
eukprot:6854965-Prymnesium_polylepis.1